MMNREGYIYIIKAETGQYKIGRTNNIPRRMNLFAVKLPFDFEIINYCPTDNMYTAEKELHQLFEEKRVNGEWFLLSEQNVEFLKALGCIRKIELSDVPEWVSEQYPIINRVQHWFSKNGKIIIPDYPIPIWWEDEEYSQFQ